MNATPLTNLKERLSALLVAGVARLDEDFRLKRAVDDLAPLAAASPLFARIEAMAKKLLAPDAENRALQLFDLLALVDAVLATQATTAVPGTLEEIPLTPGQSVPSAPYSRLVPLLTALTGTGGGRHSIIMAALEGAPELLLDHRLREAVTGGLDDSYSETADRVAIWLGKHADASFIPLLKKGFNYSNKRAGVRRIKLLSKLAGAAENDFYKHCLNVFFFHHKEGQVAAIEALRHDPGNAEYLLMLAANEKGSLRTAVQQALAWIDTPEVDAYWRKLCGKRPATVAKFLSLRPTPWVGELAAEELTEALTKHEAATGKIVLTKEECKRLTTLFALIGMKETPKVLEFYRFGAARAELLERLTCEGEAPPNVRTLPRLLTESLVATGFPALAELARELRAQYGELWVESAFTGAFLTRPAGEVFESFSPHLLATRGFTFFRKANINEERGALLEVLTRIRRLHSGKQQMELSIDDLRGKAEFAAPLAEPADPRWPALLVETKVSEAALIRTTGRGLFQTLIQLGNPREDAALRQTLCAYLLNRPDKEWRLPDLLLLLEFGHRNFRGLLARMMKSNDDYWTATLSLDYLRRLPFTSTEAGEELLEIVNWFSKRHPNDANLAKLRQTAEWLLNGGDPKNL